MKAGKYLGLTILALGFLAMAGASAMAANSKSIKLPYDATLDGTHLTSGTYNVQWDSGTPEATVTFKKGKEVVVTAKAKLEDRGHKYNDSSVMYSTGSDGSQTISEIRIAGSSEVLVFE